MSTSGFLSLEELGECIHQRVNQKFRDREIPREQISENFVRQIVQTILEELHESGQIPIIPSFKVLNRTSLEERFSGNIPDFSKHINLIGLDKDNPPDRVGIMNVAIEGKSAEEYQSRMQGQPRASSSDGETASGSPAADSSVSDDPPDEPPEQPDERRKHFRVIEGGKTP